MACQTESWVARHFAASINCPSRVDPQMVRWGALEMHPWTARAVSDKVMSDRWRKKSG
jgi:hypothetical protein